MISIVTFKVTGISPILMNNPASMNEEGKQSVRTKKTDIDEEIAKRIYVTKNGELYVPTMAFLRSLWQGASYLKIGKDSARSRIQGAVFCAEEESVLYDKDTGKPLTADDVVVDERTVVIKSTKGRIVRYRPKVENWMALVSLEIDDDFIDPGENIVPFLNIAGRKIGIMDYRPETRGPFGRYEAEVYKK